MSSVNHTDSSPSSPLQFISLLFHDNQPSRLVASPSIMPATKRSAPSPSAKTSSSITTTSRKRQKSIHQSNHRQKNVKDTPSSHHVHHLSKKGLTKSSTSSSFTSHPLLGDIRGRFDPTVLEASHNVTPLTVHSGSKINARVTAALDFLRNPASLHHHRRPLEPSQQPTAEPTEPQTPAQPHAPSQPSSTAGVTLPSHEPSSRSALLALRAQARHASKLVSVVEIVKRACIAEGLPCMPYVRVYVDLLPADSVQRKGKTTRKRVGTAEGAKKRDVGGGTLGGSGDGDGGDAGKAGLDGQDECDEDDTDMLEDEEEPAFEPMSVGTVLEKGKLPREVPMLVVYLAREKIAALERAG